MQILVGETPDGKPGKNTLVKMAEFAMNPPDTISFDANCAKAVNDVYVSVLGDQKLSAKNKSELNNTINHLISGFTEGETSLARIKDFLKSEVERRILGQGEFMNKLLADDSIIKDLGTISDTAVLKTKTPDVAVAQKEFDRLAVIEADFNKSVKAREMHIDTALEEYKRQVSKGSD